MSRSREGSAASAAFRWWRELNPPDGVRSGRQRAALARLRRAAKPVEIMLEPEALKLIARFPRDPDREDQVAVLIGVLAHVRETDQRTVARAVGRDALDDDKAVLSEGRFRRLLQARRDELLEPMRRLVRLAGGKVNVENLSDSILYWGDRVRKRWIFDYYGVAESIRSETEAPTTAASPTGQGGFENG